MPGPAVTDLIVLPFENLGGVTEIDLTPTFSTTRVHSVHRLELSLSANTTIQIVARDSLASERTLLGTQFETNGLVRDYTAEFPWYTGLKDEKIVAKFGASVNVGGASVHKSKTVPA